MITIKVDLSGIVKIQEKLWKVPFAAGVAMQTFLDQDVAPKFEATTATWKHNVEFAQGIVREGDVIIGQVSTSDRVYGYVNNGTEPHPIYPKKREFLSFQKEFTPKTKPGWIGSKNGGKSGEWVHPKFVERHAIEARKFDEAIAKEVEPKLKQRFLEEFRKL